MQKKEKKTLTEELLEAVNKVLKDNESDLTIKIKKVIKKSIKRIVKKMDNQIAKVIKQK